MKYLFLLLPFFTYGQTTIDPSLLKFKKGRVTHVEQNSPDYYCGCTQPMCVLLSNPTRCSNCHKVCATIQNKGSRNKLIKNDKDGFLKSKWNENNCYHCGLYEIDECLIMENVEELLQDTLNQKIYIETLKYKLTLERK